MMPDNPELLATTARYSTRGDLVLDSFGGQRSFRVVPIMGQSDDEAQEIADQVVAALNTRPIPALPDEEAVERLKAATYWPVESRHKGHMRSDDDLVQVRVGDLREAVFMMPPRSSIPSTEGGLREALVDAVEVLEHVHSDGTDFDLSVEEAIRRGKAALTSLPPDRATQDLRDVPGHVLVPIEVLEPFAREAEEYDFGDGSGPDMKGSPDESYLNEMNGLKIGHIRRAREALSAASKPSGDPS